MAAVPGHGHSIVASIGAILLTMTSQGRQNNLQNHSHWILEILYIQCRYFLSVAMILSNEIDFSSRCEHGWFLQS